MTITNEEITPAEALARQKSIRDLIGTSDEDIRERGDRYEFDLEEQLLAEEYIRLNLLLHGSR